MILDDESAISKGKMARRLRDRGWDAYASAGDRGERRDRVGEGEVSREKGTHSSAIISQFKICMVNSC